MQGFGPFVGCAGLGTGDAMAKGAAIKPRKTKQKTMTINQAIQETAHHFASVGEYSPSHCDVRCLINELTQDNERIVRDGYNQDLAFKRVRNILKTASLLYVESYFQQ